MGSEMCIRDSFPTDLLKPWEDFTAPYQNPKEGMTLVGTPINVLGGGEVEKKQERIQMVKLNNETKIDKITFKTEKVWNNPDNGRQTKRLKLLFKEGGQGENEIVMAIKVTVTFESRCYGFAKGIAVTERQRAVRLRLIRNGTHAIERLTQNLGTEKPETPDTKRRRETSSYFLIKRKRS